MEYNANFSIVGMVVLLQGGGPPLKPPTETEMPFIFNAFDTRGVAGVHFFSVCVGAG